jgi:predicted MFS family arabinose efflux permease
VTRLIYCQFAVFGFFLYSFAPSVTLLRDDEHISNAIAGLHSTAYAVGIVIVGAFASRILAITGRDRGFWMFNWALVAGIVAYVAVPYLWVTLVGAAIAGAAGSGLITTASAALADRHGLGGPAAITEANGVSAAVGLIGPLIVGACVALGYGWRTALLIPIAVIALLFLLRRRFGPGLDASDVDTATAYRGPLGGQFWLSWMIVVFAVCIEFCMTLWSAQLLRDNDGFGKATAATGVTAIVAGLAVGRFFGVRLAVRYSVDALLACAFAVNAAGFALFWSSNTGWLAFAGLALSGLGMSLEYPLGLGRAIRAVGGSSAAANSASAIVSLGTGVAIGIAPFVLGFLADVTTIRSAFLLVPAFIAAALGTLLIAHRRRATA